MLPVICSANVARPSCVAVVRGEEIPRLGRCSCAPVERRERVHQCFVMEQLRAIVIAEGRAAAQPDAVRTGRGLGQQVRVQRHGDHAAFEKRIQIVLQLHPQRGGRHRHLFFRRQQFTVQLLRDLNEVPRSLARARPIARHRVVRHTKQLCRVITHRCGAQRFQQPGRQPPAMRRIDQIRTERMLRVGGLRNDGQLAPGIAKIQYRVLHLRQLWLPARHALQEGLLQGRGQLANASNLTPRTALTKRASSAA